MEAIAEVLFISLVFMLCGVVFNTICLIFLGIKEQLNIGRRLRILLTIVDGLACLSSVVGISYLYHVTTSHDSHVDGDKMAQARSSYNDTSTQHPDGEYNVTPHRSVLDLIFLHRCIDIIGVLSIISACLTYALSVVNLVSVSKMQFGMHLWVTIVTLIACTNLTTLLLIPFLYNTLSMPGNLDNLIYGTSYLICVLFITILLIISGFGNGVVLFQSKKDHIQSTTYHTMVTHVIIIGTGISTKMPIAALFATPSLAVSDDSKTSTTAYTVYITCLSASSLLNAITCFIRSPVVQQYYYHLQRMLFVVRILLNCGEQLLRSSSHGSDRYRGQPPKRSSSTAVYDIVVIEPHCVVHMDDADDQVISGRNTSSSLNSNSNVSSSFFLM